MRAAALPPPLAQLVWLRHNVAADSRTILRQDTSVLDAVQEEANRDVSTPHR